MESSTLGHQKNQVLKEAFLGSGTLLFAFASGYFWRSFGSIGAGETVFGASLYLEIASVFLFAIFFALYSVLSANQIIQWIVLTGSSALLFISYSFQDMFVWGMLIALLLFFWGSVAMRRVAKSQARLQWYSILRMGTKKVFTGLSVAFAILFFAILGSSAPLQETVIPKPVFHALLPILEKPAQGLVPGFSAEGTLDDAILNAVKSQAKKDIDVSKFPKAQIQQFIAQERLALNKQFGTKFTGEEKVSDVLYAVVSKKLDEYSAPYKQYIPAALSVGYFITMQFVFTIFSWILYMVFPFVVFALLKSGFLERKGVMVEKEVITL